MAAYEYTIPGLFKTPADVAGAELMRLQNSPSGCTPAALVEASRDENAPLHNEFEWRDDVAAEKYREEQAKAIIRAVVIRTEDTNEPIRGFVVTPGNTSRYVDIVSALNNDAWHSHLLKQATTEMRAFQAKYRRLTELEGVNSAIEAFLRRGA